jgi:hypothetical protein
MASPFFGMVHSWGTTMKFTYASGAQPVQGYTIRRQRIEHIEGIERTSIHQPAARIDQLSRTRRRYATRRREVTGNQIGHQQV